MAEFPTLTLKTVPFQFGEFKPTTYTPQEVNIDILNRSMEKIEARKLQARASADTLTKATNELRAQLNPLEYEEFDNRINGIREQINNQIELGRDASAIILASDLGRELAEDKDIQNKIKTQLSFEEFRQSIDKGNYNEYTKRRSKDINQYKYDGTGNFTATFIPVEDIDLNAFYAYVTDKTPTRYSSTQLSSKSNSHTFIDAEGNITNAPSESSVSEYSSNTTVRGGSKTVTSKTVADMNKVLDSQLANGGVSDKIRQAFENMLWLRKDAKDRLANPNLNEDERAQALADLDYAESELEDKSGFIYTDPKDWRKWNKQKANDYFEAVAYTHIGTTSDISNTSDYSDSGVGARAAIIQQKENNKDNPKEVPTIPSYSIKGKEPTEPQGNWYDAEYYKDLY